MVEDHRRVESRQIVGTGMATDPERLEKIAEEKARRERAWRPQPEVAFGGVLEKAPAKGALADAVEPDKRKKENDEKEQQKAEEQKQEAPAAAAPAASSSRPKPSLPDPREKLLRQKLAALESAQQKASVKKPLTSTETPPTGNSRIKP